MNVDLTAKSGNAGSAKLSVVGELNLDILLELGSIGAGHAATALSDILQQQILIDVPKIHQIPGASDPQLLQ